MRYFYGLICLMGILLSSACSREENIGHNEDTGFRIALNDGTTTLTTRKAPAELEEPLVGQFHLRITDSDTHKTAYDGACAAAVPVKEGVYDLHVTYGDASAVALDAPCYTGSAERKEVVLHQQTPVSILCKVANSLLSVVYDETSGRLFSDAFETYHVTVTAGEQSASIEQGSDASVYFPAGSSIRVTFHATLLGTGKEIAYELTGEYSFANIAAGKHLKLHLALDAVETGMAVTLEKVEVETVTLNETIPLEWLPAPKLSEEGFTNKTLDVYETLAPEATIRFAVSEVTGLEDISFTTEFNDATFNGLNGTYLLSDMTPEDIVRFKEAGIILPLVGEKTPAIEFSSDFTGKLQAANNGTVKNTFTLNYVQANNRKNKEGKPVAYTINVHKPEFNIQVQPGNVWSKEFTIDPVEVAEGKGYAAIIADNLTYQYQDENGNWQACNDANRQVFASHPDKKTYKVRALYRGVITSNEAEVELETPMQLPNSDMEDWWIETKKKSGTWPFKDKTYYTFHPYAEGNANASWWDTNNDKAQGGTYALGLWYEGCFASCVSYTEDVHEGSKAALIYVSGCGDGYANTAGTYVGGAMVGSLFIGTYNSGIVQGHDFESRPTSLSFWYKYKPYKSDAFKVVVSLKNGDKEIATGIYEPATYTDEDNKYQQATVDFNYTDDKAKATTICVQFLASNNTSLSDNNFEQGTTITYPVIGNWTVHMGSILKIDDLSLDYNK